MDLYWVSDEFIANFIANFIDSLTNWNGEDPLPSFVISESDRELKYKCERSTPRKSGKLKKREQVKKEDEMAEPDVESIISIEDLPIEDSIKELGNYVFYQGMSQEQIEFSEITGIKF
jgi:hypothetical protein